jgi:hypothetical protein
MTGWPLDIPFYVRREECWDGTFVWYVASRKDRARKSAFYKTEREAKKRCDQMNADFERYASALWASGKEVHAP